MQTKVFKASSMQEAFANMQAELGEKANNANVNIKTINGSVELSVTFDDDSSTTNANLLEEANTAEQVPQESTIDLSVIEALLKEYSEQKLDISDILYSLAILKEFDLNKCKEKIDHAIQILDGLDNYINLKLKIKKMLNIINFVTLMKNISTKPLQLTAYMKENIIREIDRNLEQLENTINFLNTDIYSLVNRFRLSKENFEYSRTEHGIELKKYIGSQSMVFLPFIVDNMPVTSIGREAFSNCVNLTHIHIPDSVASIGYGAFSRCTSLKTISIPKNLICSFEGLPSTTQIIRR